MYLFTSSTSDSGKVKEFTAICGMEEAVREIEL
jgi:hypothetical protein